MRLNDEDTKLLMDAGMVKKTGECSYNYVTGSPKYWKCPEGHWLKTNDGGDFSLLYCPACQINYIHVPESDMEGFVYDVLRLLRKGRVTNIEPDKVYEDGRDDDD